jgi:hypothetical protein
MPPEYSHRTLTPDQIDTIRRWIDAGANWKEHWAFIAPERPKVPAVALRTWVSNPVDAFVLAALEKNGLGPAPRANRRTLIRRLSLDLTGLPPTPEEVEEFVKSTGPDAYESSSTGSWRLRAGASIGAATGSTPPATPILTVFISTTSAKMWPYRDWVISAFNANIRFDQFTVEQIAGDLLANPPWISSPPPVSIAAT